MLVQLPQQRSHAIATGTFEEIDGLARARRVRRSGDRFLDRKRTELLQSPPRAVVPWNGPGG